MKRELGVRTSFGGWTAAVIALLFLPQHAVANQWVGDLVYCDVSSGELGDPNIKGVLDGLDYGLDGVTVNIECFEDAELTMLCDTFSTTTGSVPDAFFGLCGDVATFDAAQQSGRYAVNVNPSDSGCNGLPAACRIAVDMDTVPADCDMVVTPVAGGVPFDGNGDGDYCDLMEDGPFVEDQVLGDNSTSQMTCEANPSPGPEETGVHISVHDFFPSPTECALYNDFGLMEVPGCEVAIDKTCCVPPPPVPDAAAFSCSDAKPIDSLSMIWNGGEAVRVVAYDGSVGSTVLADELVSPNGEITVSGMDGGPNDQVWEVYDADSGVLLGTSTFHISCSDDNMDGPEDCGTSQGNGKDDDSDLLDDWLFEGMAGDLALDCTPPEPSPFGETTCVVPGASTGDDCQGKVTRAVFEYTGADCADPLANDQEGKAECVGTTGGATASIVVTKDENDVSVNGSVGGTNGVAVGDTVTFTHKDGELKASTKVNMIGTDTQELTIHTSCSKSLNVGDVFGSLTLVEMTTTEGGTVVADPGEVEFLQACELPEAPPAPHCKSSVKTLEFRYDGGDCAISNTQDDKASCDGGSLSGDAAIAITKDSDKVSAVPDSSVAIGDTFTIRKDDGNKLGSTTAFEASGMGVQAIELHTSCSQPLNLGDRFGAFTLVGLETKDEGFVRIGGNVEFQYKITNTGPSPVDVRSVVEDPGMRELLDEPVMLEPGEMVTLFEVVHVDESSTSSVTVEADAGQAMCVARDELTVDVIPPPPAPPEDFVCSDAKPIDSLSMIWNGGEAVRVVAYDGSVGSTVLADELVSPNGEITVSGMDGGPNDQVWEVYDADSGVLLGTSTFHISCSDDNMDGPEDCGTSQGNGKDDDSDLLDDWLFEGMAGDLALDCTP